jgi:hypothetical protein
MLILAKVGKPDKAEHAGRQEIALFPLSSIWLRFLLLQVFFEQFHHLSLLLRQTLQLWFLETPMHIRPTLVASYRP